MTQRAAHRHGHAPPVATEAIRIDGARLPHAARPRRRSCAARSRTNLGKRLAERSRCATHAEAGGLIEFFDAPGARRGDRRAADRRVAVRALRQLREGLRRDPSRRQPPQPRGRPDLRHAARADLVPALRRPALHEGLPARRDPPRPQRRGLHRRPVHRLRQLRAQLPLRRHPDGGGAGRRSRAC